MNITGAEDTTIYKVVVNDEEQYSIWLLPNKMLLVGEMQENVDSNQNVWHTLMKCGLI